MRPDTAHGSCHHVRIIAMGWRRSGYLIGPCPSGRLRASWITRLAFVRTAGSMGVLLRRWSRCLKCNSHILAPIPLAACIIPT
jgi:hypothetical protein